MIFRTVVIGLLMPVVLLGSGAGAEALTGLRPPSRTRPGHQTITVNVFGRDNVIATDGSVLTVGDHSPVNANTGGVSSGGILGIDTERSSLTSGADGHPVNNARLTGEPSQGPAVRRPGRAGRVAGDRREPSAALVPGRIAVPGQGQGVAISGYEDHSVRVAGDNQMAVYDDSNLFVNRNGKLNGNTGDTDSSGLNAVDVSGSTIRSGNHIEGAENDGDSGDDKTGASPTGQAERPTATRPLPAGQASSTVTDEGASRAAGGSALTIGGDGYDNLGVNVEGRRNIAAYDDSNAVVGGTGPVNAQIGDSDTSGAVVMGIRNSRIQSGDST